MNTSISAHFDGTHFVPDEPVIGLAPGERVSVVRVAKPPSAAPSQQNDPLLAMLDLATETGIEDLAENADYYLYGHPKQTETGQSELSDDR